MSLGPVATQVLCPSLFQDDALEAWAASGIPILDFAQFNYFQIVLLSVTNPEWYYFQVSAAPAPVPEPSTVALLAVSGGFCALSRGIKRVRRRTCCNDDEVREQDVVG